MSRDVPAASGHNATGGVLQMDQDLARDSSSHRGSSGRQEVGVEVAAVAAAAVKAARNQWWSRGMKGGDNTQGAKYDYDEPAELADGTVMPPNLRSSLDARHSRNGGLADGGGGDCGFPDDGSLNESCSGDDERRGRSIEHGETDVQSGLQSLAISDGARDRENSRFGGGTRGKSGIAHDDDALEGTVNSSRQVGSGGEAGGEGRETAAAVGAKVSLRQYEDGHYRHLNRHDDERDMGSEDEAEYENEEFDDDDDDDDAFHDGQLEGGDEHDARSGDAGADGGLRSDRGGVARDGYYGGGGRQLAEDDGGMENVYDEVHDALRHGEDMSGEVDDAWRPEQQRYDPQDDGARGDPKWRRYPAAPGSVPPLKSGDSDSGVDDLEWDLRVGLSADSSVSVSESGEGLRGKVEDMGYEMEDAQSV
ncbi:unnamed protein product [Sphacelaria rigidula]